ncbi:CD99 antigen-like protein 2 isoform X4 [Callorhinchus milii]|uniref:CD99 antigen-like protein 2 isoform X4 n=1 Tax=Callorhinchus milii TaxID=7868 RepID=UPI001C3FDB36|nr:CD99 antigen-like protein 2 isoform X4 [Callorhinchus milii]
MAIAVRVFLLCISCTVMTTRVLGDHEFDWDLSDALDDVTPKRHGTFLFSTALTTPSKPSSGTDDLSLWDFFPTSARPGRKTTKSPKTTKKPPMNIGDDDFDLADALDDGNDKYNKGGKGGKGGSDFSDQDLDDTVNGGGYNPDKKKSGGNTPSDDQNPGQDMPPATIAGITSGLAVAVLGAVSSFIAYQKKQLCFKIQDYVKGGNLQSEPPVEGNLLQTQSAQPSADSAIQV